MRKTYTTLGHYSYYSNTDLVHQRHIPQKVAISFLIASKKPHFHSNCALRFIDLSKSYPTRYWFFWSVCIINHQPRKSKDLEKSIHFIPIRILNEKETYPSSESFIKIPWCLHNYSLKAWKIHRTFTDQKGNQRSYYNFLEM